MKTRIEIAKILGEVLPERLTDDVLLRAEEQNPWFRPQESKQALLAICEQMLRPETLERWVSQYPNISQHEPKRTLVIMSGNIPLVGFADLLAALIVGDEIFVKPSSKDSVLMLWLIRTINEIEPRIPIYIYNGMQPVDRVLAMGSDKTMAHFASHYASTPTLLRGTRHSIAIVENDAQLALLEQDIYLYSGMGCRNVSLIWLKEGVDLKHFPRCETHPKFRNNYLQNKALLTMEKADFFDTGSCCLLEQDCFAKSIGTLSIMRYDSVEQIEEWLMQNDTAIQCIVASEDIINHPRQVAFGKAQQPSLTDYSDGEDTINFLLC